MGNYKVEYLTDIQEKILGRIRRQIDETGEAPTVKEIADGVGRSASTVHYQLVELEAKYAIVREPRHPRGIRLT